MLKNNNEKLNITFTNTEGLRLSDKDSPAWSDSYKVTESLIKKFNIKKMAEIGVARGHHSEHLLEAIPDLHLYSIDPWGYYNDEHIDMWKEEQKELDIIYNNVKNLLKPFGDRSTIIRSTSKRASQEIKEPLDMIFIDADHSYKSVKEDLGFWYDKVKENGIISGHDYNHPQHPGVTVAVKEFFINKDIKINEEIGTVWWVKKEIHNLTILKKIKNKLIILKIKIFFKVVVFYQKSISIPKKIIKKIYRFIKYV